MFAAASIPDCLAASSFDGFMRDEGKCQTLCPLVSPRGMECEALVVRQPLCKVENSQPRFKVKLVTLKARRQQTAISLVLPSVEEC
jgi:hypothetical protein